MKNFPITPAVNTPETPAAWEGPYIAQNINRVQKIAGEMKAARQITHREYLQLVGRVAAMSAWEGSDLYFALSARQRLLSQLQLLKISIKMDMACRQRLGYVRPFIP